MANMQWSQLRPIHDAAAALDGLADDATADELADAVSQAMEHLAKALDVLEISDRVAARLIPKWKSTNGSLRNAISDRSSEISRRLLDANDGKSLPVVVESDNGEQVVCTPKVSIRRSESNGRNFWRQLIGQSPIPRIDLTLTGQASCLILMQQSYSFTRRYFGLSLAGLSLRK